MFANSSCRCLSEPPACEVEPSCTARRVHIAWLFRTAPGPAGLVAALLLPKCPLCVAAWAAAAGIGAVGQHFLVQALNPGIRPFFLAVLVLPLSLQIALVARARMRRQPPFEHAHDNTRSIFHSLSPESRDL